MSDPIKNLARLVYEASEGKVIGICGVAINSDGTPQIFSSLDAGLMQHIARSCLGLLVTDIENDIRDPDPIKPAPEAPTDGS